MVVNNPAAPWLFVMLQIFVPAATALLMAAVAYRFSVRGAKERDGCYMG